MSCLHLFKPPFFHTFKLKHNPMKKGTPLPKPPFFYAFQTGIYVNEKKAPHAFQIENH